MQNSLAYAAALATILIWGLAVIPVKHATTSGRLGLAFSLPAGLFGLTLAALCLGVRLPGWSELGTVTGLVLVAVGVCEFPAATLAYYEAVRRSELSVAVPLTRMKVVFVAVLALLLGIETVTPRLMLACAVGTLGAVILSRSRPVTPRPTAAPLNRGALLALLAAFFWAVGDVLSPVAMRRLDPLPLTLLALLAGTIVYYGYLLAAGQVTAAFRIPRRDKLLFCGHGLFSFGLAYYTFYYAILRLGVTRTAVITASWPLVSFAVGLAFYRERVTAAKCCGIVLIAASIVMALGR